MVNPISHWIWIPFGTRPRIPLRRLYQFRVIEFRITLRGLSGFRFPPGLVVPAGSLKTLYLIYSSIAEIWNMLADGSQWSLSLNIIWWHFWNYSSVVQSVVSVKVVPFIPIEMKSSFISIPRDWCQYVGLYKNEIPPDIHWFLFISDCSICGCQTINPVQRIK